MKCICRFCSCVLVAIVGFLPNPPFSHYLLEIATLPCTVLCMHIFCALVQHSFSKSFLCATTHCTGLYVLALPLKPRQQPLSTVIQSEVREQGNKNGVQIHNVYMDICALHPGMSNIHFCHVKTIQCLFF